MSKYLRTGVIYCLFAAGAAHADEVSDLQQCAEIEDDASRLACYDRTLGKPAASDAAGESAAMGAAKVSATAAIAESVAPADSAEAAKPVPESTAPTQQMTADVAKEQTVATAPADSAPRAAAAAPSEPADDFGLSDVPVKEEPDTRSGEITAVVTEVTREPLGEHVVVLDNGQVWRQQSATSYFPVKPADTVTIKERRFSGYMLITASGRGYGVRRIH